MGLKMPFPVCLKIGLNARPSIVPRTSDLSSSGWDEKYIPMHEIGQR